MCEIDHMRFFTRYLLCVKLIMCEIDCTLNFSRVKLIVCKVDHV